MVKKLKSLPLLLALMLAPASLLRAQEPERPIAPAEQARLANLLPAPSLLRGAAEPARFYAADLYKYIDGGAESYHVYGLVAMAHREYKADDLDLTVDVHDLGNAMNAFGIYAAERSPESHFITAGAEGYIDRNILNFLQGQFYVKISAFSDKQKTEPVMQAFADDISRRIGGAKRMPAPLSMLPESGLVARSQKYLKKAPLGHEFLAPALVATYAFGRKQSTLLLCAADTIEQAREKAEALKNYFIKSGKAIAEPGLAPGAYRGANSPDGEMIFFSRGRHVVILVDPPPDAGVFLKQLRLRD